MIAYPQIRWLAVACVVALAACGNLSDGTKRGYQFFVNSFEDADGATLGTGYNIDVFDCQNVDGTDVNFVVEDDGIAELAVEIDDETELFVNLTLQLTALQIRYEPLTSVDPDNAGALIPLDPMIVNFEEDAGPTFFIGDSGNATFDYNVPIMTVGKKREYIDDVDAYFGLDPDFPDRTQNAIDESGIYAQPQYQLIYTFWAMDNFGNDVSTTTSFVFEITEYADDCN